MVGRTFRKNGGSGASNTTPEQKEVVMEFIPHIAGKHQSVTYDTVKEHIMQELQMELRHGCDIVECLRNGVNTGIPITKPTRQIEAAGNQSVEEQKTNQDGHDMEWQIERKECGVRKTHTRGKRTQVPCNNVRVL